MIINSGVTNIQGIEPYAVGNVYRKNDVVYFSGYQNGATEVTCSEQESGHWYFSGNGPQTATTSNTPISTTNEWTQDFYFEPSYGAKVDYEASYYGIEFGDGYYNFMNRSENALRATFNVSFNKRDDKETKALIHLLEDSFNKGEEASNGQGYTGIRWTPFEPYNLSGRFFVENFDQQYENPAVNTVSTQFFNETRSTTDWQQFAIPWESTRGYYHVDKQYHQHDMAFFKKWNDETVTPAESGWYYVTGVTPSSGLKSDAFNSPTGAATIWTKNKFYFDVGQGAQINQAPRFVKQDLQNNFYVRMKDGLNKNLLTFTMTFRGRTDKEAKAMVHFLEHHRGTDLISFELPNPYNLSGKVFICRKWSHQLNFKDNNDIAVDFLEFPIDYLQKEKKFNTLITIVNRPLQDFEGPLIGGATSGPTFDGGSTSTITRREGTSFVSNTGLATYAVTGFTMRTGFYITNSGTAEIQTNIRRSDSFYAFEYPSGISKPINIKPGENAFIPFYFNGMMDNISGPSSYAATGPFKTGAYDSYLTIESHSLEDGGMDPSGPITLGITGYVTGWDVNPYKGIVDDNPGSPERFLIHTGLYGPSGYPRLQLQWKMPASGYYATRYCIQNSEDNSNWTGVDYVNIDKRTVYDTQGGETLQTYLYTGAMVLPSLAQEPGNVSQPYVDYWGVEDPDVTGIRQPATYLHTELGFDKDYYYRIRSEFQPIDGTAVSGSAWVYASGTDDLRGPFSNNVSTGLMANSAAYSKARTVIKTGPKRSFDIYLVGTNFSTQAQDALNRLPNTDPAKNAERTVDVNLSGLFDQELIARGMIEDHTAEVPVPATGIYHETYTGVKFIIPTKGIVGASATTQTVVVTANATVADEATSMTILPIITSLDSGDVITFGSSTFTLDKDASAGAVTLSGTAAGGIANGTEGTCSTSLAAIETGYQLITGVVQPADAGNTNANTQKPLAETPTLLIMQGLSSAVGAGGTGGNGGWTYVSAEPHKAAKNLQLTKYSINDNSVDSEAGGRGGDAVAVTHKDIAKFEIHKNYTSMIYSGGGGGGGGDRLGFENAIVINRKVNATNMGDAPSFSEIKRSYADLDPSTVGADGKWTLAPKDAQFAADYWGEFAGYYARVSAGELVGNHLGGAGGGGQGYGIAPAGKMVDTSIKPAESHSATITIDGDYFNGRLTAAGDGWSFSTSEAIGQVLGKANTAAQGGGGGAFGAEGDEGLTKESTDVFARLDSARGKSGGAPGDAIKILDYDSGTHHYTAANYRGKLLFIGPRTFDPGDIDGLVAQFDASDTSNILDSSDGSISNNELVKTWKSKNDPTNVYLQQTTSANMPRFYTGTTTQPSDLDATTPLNSSYFNGQNFIYFESQSSSQAEYFTLTGATGNEVTVDANAVLGDTSLKIASLGINILSGTHIYFENGSEFVVDTNATASGSQVTLSGKLYRSNIAKSTQGWMKLSSLMRGFEIFYMMYPDKWNVEGSGLTFKTKPPVSTTGFTRFSDMSDRVVSQYYGSETITVQETMGLGGTNVLNFYDWVRAQGNIMQGPERSWVYSVAAQNGKRGTLNYLASNDGMVVGQENFTANAFNFMSAPLIGASQLGTSASVGLKGAIAEILIYARVLKEAERRSVIGYLHNKYLKLKTFGNASGEILTNSNNNVFGRDRTRLAGPISFR